MKKSHEDYSLIFYIHTIIIFIFIFSWLFFSWWIIIIGEILLQLQYHLLKGCILSKAEFGYDEPCIPYYLFKWKLIKNKHKTKIFVRHYLPLIIIIISLIWQLLLNINPLIY